MQRLLQQSLPQMHMARSSAQVAQWPGTWVTLPCTTSSETEQMQAPFLLAAPPHGVLSSLVVCSSTRSTVHALLIAQVGSGVVVDSVLATVLVAVPMTALPEPPDGAGGAAVPDGLLLLWSE